MAATSRIKTTGSLLLPPPWTASNQNPARVITSPALSLHPPPERATATCTTTAPTPARAPRPCRHTFQPPIGLSNHPTPSPSIAIQKRVGWGTPPPRPYL